MLRKVTAFCVYFQERPIADGVCVFLRERMRVALKCLSEKQEG